MLPPQREQVAPSGDSNFTFYLHFWLSMETAEQETGCCRYLALWGGRVRQPNSPHHHVINAKATSL